MGVTTVPVIEMNRYTKSACRCTWIDQYVDIYIHIQTCALYIYIYMSAHVCFLENNCEDGHVV